LLFCLFLVLILLSIIKNFNKNFEPKLPKWSIVPGAFMIGIIISMVGVGGGFLIVPFLVAFVPNLDFKKAIGTSTFIITVTSLYNVAQDFVKKVNIDCFLAEKLVFIAGLGLILGVYLNTKISSEYLKKFFSYLLILIFFIIVVDRGISIYQKGF
jgi:uncharacterized protein